MTPRTLVPAGLLLAALLPVPADALAAQQGTITYTHTRRIDFELPPGMDPPPRMERMREAMPDAQTRTVALRFTPRASLMTAEPGQESDWGATFRNRMRSDRAAGAAVRGRVADAVRGGRLPPGLVAAGAFGGAGGDQISHTYLSHEDDTLVETREFMGRTFRVTSPRPELHWRMTSEQAEHLGRLVIKATATRERGPGPAGRAGRGAGPGRRGDGPVREIAVEAWFAPEIPVPGGPAGYGGLPGMILVLSEDDGRVQYAATEIALDGADGEGAGGASATEPLQPPEEGDALTREEYDAMVREKMEELRRTMRRPPGGEGGD